MVCGDLKHDFAATTYEEYREVFAFLSLAQKLFPLVLVCKGNHDTFVLRAASKLSIKVFDQKQLAGNLFFHGHVLPSVPSSAHTLVMGNEHPALALRNEAGVVEKLKCFLYGKTFDNRNLLVLPAFSMFAEGTAVNEIESANELFSPALRELCDYRSLRALAFLEGEQALEFPRISDLQPLG